MVPSLPIFESHDAHYRADTCRGLVQGVKQGEVRLAALARGHYPGRRLSRGVLSGVKSVGFWDAATGQDWGLDWHRNEGIEFTLLETGQLGFATGGKSVRLRPDDLTITRPWQQHRVGDPHVAAGRLHWLILDVGVRRPDQPWKWPDWVILSGADLERLTDFLRHNEQPVWSGAVEVRQCFRRIADVVETDRDGSAASELTIRLNELLLLVLDVFRNRDAVLDKSLSEKQRSVELFLIDLRSSPGLLAREWTVPQMAHCCGLGETRFSHYCRTLTNMTPLRYLSYHRLEMAARLLRENSDWSVAEVAAAAGFTSSQYFATAFGRRFGCSPGQWRGATSDG